MGGFGGSALSIEGTFYPSGIVQLANVYRVDISGTFYPYQSVVGTKHHIIVQLANVYRVDI